MSGGNEKRLSASTRLLRTVRANEKKEESRPSTAAAPLLITSESDDSVVVKDTSPPLTRAKPSPPAAPPRATSLLNRDVKVLTQSLGAEDQWMECGDGRVTFCDFVIRVTADAAPASPPRRVDESSSDAKASEGGEYFSAALNPLPSESTVKSDGAGERIILEDTITTETPFVGENFCIVWNSFEQQLSICLMYVSEEGYAASWSALVAMQEKNYPPLRFDLLERCRPAVPVSSEAATPSPPPGLSTDVLPYSYFIHDAYQPPLGFIERHALSLSVMEHGHSLNPQLFAEKNTTMTLLTLANADLIEHLVSADVFPLLLRGLRCEVEPTPWSVPSGLQRLQFPEEVSLRIAMDLRLTYLQDVALPRDTSEELIMKIVIISHRLRHELACTLLSSNETLAQAREALLVVPPATRSLSRAASTERLPRPASSLSVASDSRHSLTSAAPQAGGPSVASAASNAAAELTAAECEQQVLAHLRFLRNLVSLSFAELGRDLIGAVVANVFSGGLLEALSLVAERFALPAAVLAKFVSSMQDNERRLNSGSYRRRNNPALTTPTSSPFTTNYYSPAVEQELTWLLDATIVRVNERQEEQLMNEIVRAPILAEPERYHGLMLFLIRSVLVGEAVGTPGQRRGVRDNTSARNPLLLFHILGLHDDEGTAGAERATDVESAQIRYQFHKFAITKYIAQACRGIMAPVPMPPFTGSHPAVKSSPIVQFSNVGANGPATSVTLPLGISPALIRLLEYLLHLTTLENREVLLKVTFSQNSRILQFIEGCCNIACVHPRGIGLDILCGNVRLLRMGLSFLSPCSTDNNESSIHLFAIEPDVLHPATVTAICRVLTVGRDTFDSVLRAYNTLGGVRRTSLFHSAVLSLLDLIERHQPLSRDSDNTETAHNTLRDVRNYIFFKHLDKLPQRTAQRFQESLLSEVSAHLGRTTTFTPNNSASLLSSTAGSEMLRSSSKLRYVDEVEAAAGGVDGTFVPNRMMSLSPEIIASAGGAEEKLAKRVRHVPAEVEGPITTPHGGSLLLNGSSMHQHGGTRLPAHGSSPFAARSAAEETSSRPLSSDEYIGSAVEDTMPPIASSPTTINISRPSTDSLTDSSSESPSWKPLPNDGEGILPREPNALLTPTSPTAEKNSSRPHSPFMRNRVGTGASRRVPQNGAAGGPVTATAVKIAKGPPTGGKPEGVVLPKLSRRTSNT